MKLILPGIPISQSRMKFSRFGGFVKVYDPNEKQKKVIKQVIQHLFESHQKFEHPKISFVFHLPILKSIPKKLLPSFTLGFVRHEKKPDVDNFIKLYLDCLDGICFDGDQKVSLGDSVKLYHPHPKTIIIITEMQELLNPLEVDILTRNALLET